MSDTSTTTPDEHGERTPAEWITLAVAGAILLAVVGLIVYDWITTPATPPDPQVTQGIVRVTNNQFQIPFTVRNTGGETAQTVQIIAELTVDGNVVEDGEQQIEFLSSGETEQGAFVFSTDPASGELTVRVASYKVP